MAGPAMIMHGRKLDAFLKGACPSSGITDWNTFAVSVFWSNPHISQDQWIDRLLQKSHSASGILADSMTYVSIRSFFNFFPKEPYLLHWPEIRLYSPKRLFRRRALYDMAWSILATGTNFVAPLQEWFSLSENERGEIIDVSKKLKKPLREISENISQEKFQKIVQAGFLQINDGYVFPGTAHRIMQNKKQVRNVKYKVKAFPNKIFITKSDGSF